LVPQLLFFEQTEETTGSESMDGVGQTGSERTTVDYLLARVKNIKSSNGGLDSVLTSLKKLKKMELSNHERQSVQG
jgi:hypothetical protein